MAGGEVSEKAGIPAVGTSCTNPLVTQAKNIISVLVLLTRIRVLPLATYAFEKLGFKKGAVLMDMTNDYACGSFQLF